MLLAQELISDIEKRGKPSNVVEKLDMAKAYDSLSWFFLIKFLNKMGFSRKVIDAIWRLVSNNYYSILLNGQAVGFFHSTRGVKQWDPLSPTLFILIPEVIMRALNELFDDEDYVGYGLSKWSSNINHLAYADDTIIFSSSNVVSMQKIMKVLQEYEKEPGQKINKEKRFFYMHKNTQACTIQHMEQVTGMGIGAFPLKYLSCPITYSKKKKEDFIELVDKIKSKLQTWKGIFLSSGGKEV